MLQVELRQNIASSNVDLDLNTTPAVQRCTTKASSLAVRAWTMTFAFAVTIPNPLQVEARQTGEERGQQGYTPNQNAFGGRAF